ncbi:MAG: hypothetical protein KJ592_00240 [Nanoarchaeota archaeon]|nr:hypothetical protein [Nanoarchaeota archaeon]
MKKELGYVVSVVGIVLMALGFGIFDLGFEFLNGVSGNYVAGAGIVLIVVGVMVSLKSGGSSGRKVDDGKSEVPIYEGTGKNRRVVGYRKD